MLRNLTHTHFYVQDSIYTVYKCVCVCERERERGEKEGEREGGGERGKGGGGGGGWRGRELTSSCSVILIINSASINISKMYLGAMSTRDCLADGVIPCWTTIIARDMFSSCILWQYLQPYIHPAC